MEIYLYMVSTKGVNAFQFIGHFAQVTLTQIYSCDISACLTLLERLPLLSRAPHSWPTNPTVVQPSHKGSPAELGCSLLALYRYKVALK